MFERILVALKFGPAGMFALNKSLEIARKNDAELHIFHALDYLLQNHDEKDPKLIAAKKEKQQRYKTEVEPLVGDLKNVTFRCLPAPALSAPPPWPESQSRSSAPPTASTPSGPADCAW